MRNYKLINPGIVFFIVLSLFLFKEVAGDAVAAEKTIPILFASGQPAWTSYGIAVAASNVVNKNSNFDITVRSYSGALTIIEALVQGEAQLGNGPFDTTLAMAYHGKGDYAKKGPRKDIRAAINYMAMRFTWLVPGKSDIKTIRDLKGKKVARIIAGDNMVREVSLAAYGLDPKKDVEWINIPSEDAFVQEMIMGRIDAIYNDLGGADVIEAAEAVGLIRPLPIEPDKLAWMQSNHPNLFNGQTIKYVQPGWRKFLKMDRPTPVAAIPMPVSTSVSAPADLVYEYVKVWLRNIDKMRKISADMGEFNADMVQTASGVPYHDGAIRALKDFGLWTSGMEAAHQKALKQ